jgi:hypothetical protein
MIISSRIALAIPNPAVETTSESFIGKLQRA